MSRYILPALVIGIIAPGVHALPLSEIEIAIPVQSQTVTVRVKTDLQIATTEKAVQVNVIATTNLSDFQNKFDAIVKSLPLPRDNCPGFGQHVLPRIESAALRAQGSNAILELIGTAEVWDCQKNPLREMVVHSEQKCLAGICTDVPTKIEWREGSPIKNKYLTEGFTATVPFTLTTLNGSTIDVKPGDASVTPRGDLGKFFNKLAGIFNADLSNVAQKELEKFVDAGVLRKTIPPEMMKYNFSIKLVQFRSENGVLLNDVAFQSEISGDSLSEFLKKALEDSRQK